MVVFGWRLSTAVVAEQGRIARAAALRNKSEKTSAHFLTVMRVFHHDAQLGIQIDGARVEGKLNEPMNVVLVGTKLPACKLEPELPLKPTYFLSSRLLEVGFNSYNSTPASTKRWR